MRAALHGLLACLALASCREEPPELPAPQAGLMRAVSEGIMTSAPASCGPVYLDGRPLAPEDEATLCSLLVGLPSTRSEIYTKPDLELALKAPGSNFVLSVFLGPGLLCAGQYLGLWEQRMKGGASDCLALTPEARALFTRLQGAKQSHPPGFNR